MGELRKSKNGALTLGLFAERLAGDGGCNRRLGMGWLTTEELKWDDKGRLLTHSPDTYKLPAIGDIPQLFNVSFLKNATQESVVFGSKAVGEPPLMVVRWRAPKSRFHHPF